MSWRNFKRFSFDFTEAFDEIEEEQVGFDELSEPPELLDFNGFAFSLPQNSSDSKIILIALALDLTWEALSIFSKIDLQKVNTSWSQEFLLIK